MTELMANTQTQQLVKYKLEKLNELYPNSIAIFGGAFHIVAHMDDNDMSYVKRVASCLPEVIDSAKFYRWHEGVAAAIKKFCNLCFVDPALMEAYLGCRLEEVV